MVETIETKMEKTIDDLKNKIAAIRTNRANPDMLKNIQVLYYGTAVPLSQLASITTPEPTSFLISVFDQGAIKDIEKAISQSALGLNPQVEGSTLRIALPELTQDRRAQLIKILKKTAEDAKVAIRNIRRDTMDWIKAEEKKKELTEDVAKEKQQIVQKSTDTFISLIDSLVASKEKQLTTL